MLRGTWGDDYIFGRLGDDQLFGLRGNDVLVGGHGQDVLWGYAGDDSLWGGAGDDSLWGGKGRDVLHGGEGNDWLRGNGDADIFVFGARLSSGDDDVIDDFTDGEDLIDVQLVHRLDGFDDVIAVATQVGSHVRIDLPNPNAHKAGTSGGTITLHNFDIADLDASDFLF